tara:strand:+ start:93 stop:533 length:441 start_codon:yes stop_codon:yes gene_type:complete
MKINLHFVKEYLETSLSQLAYFYVPTKANKKKVKDYFESFPFFFFDLALQNQLYAFIQKRPIVSYYDSNENLKTFCYLIYKDFNLSYDLPIKTQEDFYKHLEFQIHSETAKYKQWKKNNIHHFLFFVLLILMGFCYYYLETKNEYS